MFRVLATAVVYLAFVASSVAQTPPQCWFSIPDPVKTIVFGVYEGETTTAVDLDVERRGATRQVTVRVVKQDHPVFLVMSAYSPVLWNLDIEPETEIAGILIFGYYRQAVANVPDYTNVGFSTLKDGVGEGCPKYNWFYSRSDQEYHKAEIELRNSFDLRIDNFYGTYRAACLPGGCDKASQRSLWKILFGSKEVEARSKTQSPIRLSNGEFLEAIQLP